MILLIDNYDSFAYNLARYFVELGEELTVRRNDTLSLGDVAALRPDHIVISPGPCTPKEAGISNEVIRHFAGRVPVLGVCLGHQCIGHVFGADVKRAKTPIHGKTDFISHKNTDIFTGLPNPLNIMRYHSLIIDNLPDCLEATAVSDTTGEIMGVRHKDMHVYGVQFHPESVLSQAGHSLLANFLRITEEKRENTSRTRIA